MGKGDGGAKRASSSKAAEALAARGGGAVSGFGGFSGASAAAPAAPTGFAFGAAAAARLAAARGGGSSEDVSAASSTQQQAGSMDAGPSSVLISSQLDGEVAQCLRHLNKRDTTTKLKALQGLRGLLPTKAPANVALTLGPFAYMYSRLSTDSSRSVRAEAATTLGQLAQAAGKALAPHLKSLIGPWWVAQFDPHGEAAAAARSGFQACFPGRKQVEALLFCRSELVAHLGDNLAATAAQLGDPRKDTPEELEERQERVHASSLLALGTLLEVLAAAAVPGPSTSGSSGNLSADAEAAAASSTPAAGGNSSAASRQAAQFGEVCAGTAAVLQRPGALKATTGSKSPLVRAAAYSLLKSVAAVFQQQHQQQQEGQAPPDSAAAGEGVQGLASVAGGAEIAAAVLGAFSEKDPGNHSTMWGMVLTYVQAFPGAWSLVNLRKMFLPRLTAFLRSGCYGSHTVSWPALLPLLSVLPKDTLYPGGDVAAQLLEATWSGLQDPSAARSGRSAGTAAYAECLAWLSTSALSAGGTGSSSTPDSASSEAPAQGEEYVAQLLRSSLIAHPLPAALSGTSPQSQHDLGVEVITGLVQRLSQGVGARASVMPAAGKTTEGVSSSTETDVSNSTNSSSTVKSSASAASLALVQAAVATGLGEALRSALADSGSAAVFTRADTLISSVTQVNPSTGSALASVAAGMLMSEMQGGAGQLPAAATQLLAALVRAHGAAISSASQGTGEAAAAAAGTTSSSGRPTETALGGQDTPTTSTAGSHTFSQLQGLVTSCLSLPSLSGPAADAQLELLLSWLHSYTPKQQPQAWAVVLGTATGLDLNNSPAATGADKSSAASSSIGSPERDKGYRLAGQLLSRAAAVSANTTGANATPLAGVAPAAGALSAAVTAPEVLAQAGIAALYDRAGDCALAGLLGVLLGANPAGAVLIPTQSALTALAQLSSIIAASTGAGGVPLVEGTVAAAIVAVGALRQVFNRPAGSVGSGSIWDVCAAEVALLVPQLAPLAWRAGIGGSGTAGGQQHSQHDEDQEEEEEEEYEEEEEQADDHDSADDEEHAEEDVQVHSTVQHGRGGGRRHSPWVQALHTEASKAWAGGGLLKQAAGRLPPDHLQAVLLQLVSCLTQEVLASAALLNDALPVAVIKAGGQVNWQQGDIAGARAIIRTCAYHAQQLVLSLGAQPHAQQQLVTMLLQQLAPDCRVWTAGASEPDAQGSHSSGVGGSSGGDVGAAGVLSATGLAVVAQLIQLVGPGLVLGLETSLPEEDTGSSDHGADDAAAGVQQQQQQPQDRAWLLAELVCCRLAVTAQAVGNIADDDEEEDEVGLHPAYKQVLPLLKASPQSPAVRKALASQAGPGLLQRGRTAPIPVGDLALSTCISSLSNPSSSAYLRGVVHLLTHKAAADQAANDASQVSIQVQALRCVLSQVAAAAGSSLSTTTADSAARLSPATKLLESVCATHLLPLGQPQALASPSAPVLLELLPVVAPPLRAPGAAAEALEDSSLTRLSSSLMSHSLSSPPVIWEEGQAGVPALQAAVAAFPVPQEVLLESTGRYRSPGITAAERTQLLKLLKHHAVRQATTTLVKGASTSSLSTSTGTTSPARAALAELELSAALYCAPVLDAAEWSTILKDAQVSLSSAVSSFQATVGALAGGLRSAAALVLGQSSSQPVTGVMAARLLGKLQERGLLEQHPALVSLLSDWESALSAWQLGCTAREGARTAHVLLGLLQVVSSTKQDALPKGLVVLGQQYRGQVTEACEEILKLALLAGVAEAVCSLAGPPGRALLHSWRAGACAPGSWDAVGAAAAAALAASLRPGAGGLAGAALSALTEVDKRTSEADAGCDTVDGLLALCLEPPVSSPAALSAALRAPSLQDLSQAHQWAVSAGQQCRRGGALQGSSAGSAQYLRDAAYTALLQSPSVLASLSFPLVAQADGGEEAELPEYEQGTDVGTYLASAGLRPALASVLGAATASSTASSGQQLSSRAAVTPSRSTHLTAWTLLLSHLAALPPDAPNARTLRQALREVPQLVPGLLDALVQYLPLEQYMGGKANAAGRTPAPGSAEAHDVVATLRDIGLPQGPSSRQALGRALYGAVLHALPASARTWFGDLRDRGVAAALEAYTSARESPALVAAEMSDISARTSQLASDKFNVRASAATREVVAMMEVEDGASLEMCIRLPPSMPLRPPEVECRKKVGVSDTRLRKWLLSIAAFLRTNNRGVGDAIAMWKANLESEFAGVEPCLICYSVVAATNSALPKLQCRTCQVRFHPGCLYKWFKSSGKSMCPHCQTPW